MKRIFAVVLVMALCLTLTPGVFASGEMEEVISGDKALVLAIGDVGVEEDNAPDIVELSEAENGSVVDVMAREEISASDGDVFTMLENSSIIDETTIPTTVDEELFVDGGTRYELVNTKKATGQDILTEARKWSGTSAAYWSGTTPWQASIYWRTGYTYEGQTSFDCCGFVARVLNDAGFRGKSYAPSYGNSILKEKYGSNFIAISVADLLKYGTCIDDAVTKAKSGDYSELEPGDIIGWLSGSLGRHVIIYAGKNSNGKPMMIEWNGNGYRERLITPFRIFRYATSQEL